MGKEIIVFSDVHYSKNWDILGTCLANHPRMDATVLNPNHEFRYFIDRVNTNPNVELVINNGDAVDYYYSDYRQFPDFIRKRSKSLRESNWDLFNAALNRLNKPYLAIAGNHDYRREPYNYALWGTDHIHLPERLRKNFIKQIGHHNFRGLFELSTIISNNNPRDLIRKCKHLKTRAHLDVQNFAGIFLDSGPDAWVKSRNFFDCFKKTLRTRALSYDMDGLNSEDLDFISRVLGETQQADILIFQHAPWINTNKRNLYQSYPLSIEDFNDTNTKIGLAYHTFINGRGELLNILKDTPKNITIIASHIHHASYFLIDKKRLTAIEVSLRELNSERANPDYIKQLTTLPLGVVCPEADSLRTGYLKISPNGFEEIVLRNFS